MKNRNLLMIGLLSIVTFGLYLYHWSYENGKSLREKGYEIPNMLYLYAPLIATIVGIIGILGMAISSGGGAESNDTLNRAPGILNLLLLITWIPYIYWHYKFYKATEHLLGGKPSFIMLIVLEVLGLGFINIFLIQSGINKLLQGPSNPWQQPQQTQ